MALTDAFLIGNFIITFRDVVTLPVISFVLLAIFFLGIVMQLLSERLNLYGILSILSLLVFFSGHLMNDTGGNPLLSLALFVFGAFLIVVEFFVIGTFLGIVGSIFLLISILSVTGSLLMYSLFLLIIIFAVIILWVILVKGKKRRIPFLDRLILNDATDDESGYSSFDDRSDLVGQVARTSTPLRPAGMLRVGDERIDAVAEGGFINKDVDVKIIHVEGTRVVVRPVEE